MGNLDLDLSDLIEGQTIKKESITGVYGKLNDSLEDKIGPENIREEGLDRRVFANLRGVHYQTGEFCQILGSAKRNAGGPEGFSWGRLSGLTGSHGEYPRVDFTWDPEIDTYAVVRCSFFVEQVRKDSRSYSKYSDSPGPGSYIDGFDFALGVSFDGASFSRLKISNRGSTDICFPYARVALNPAFSTLCNKTTTADGGAPLKHKFDRTSSVRQSVCLFHVFGVSAARYPLSDPGMTLLNAEKTVNVGLLTRRHRFYNYKPVVLGSPSYAGSEDSETNSINISNLNMYVTKYRR